MQIRLLTFVQSFAVSPGQRWLFSWILLLSLVGYVEGSPVDYYPQFSADKISDDLKKGANAVVRFHHQVVKLERTNLMTVKETAAITVLNKRADHFLNFYKGFKASSDNISNIVLEYLDASGQVIAKVKPKEIEEVTPPDGISLISDHKAKYFGYESNSYPITIKYSFERKSTTTLFLPTWRPIPGHRVSVETSKYSFINATDSKIVTHEVNTEGLEIERNELLQYSLKNAKRIISERYDPHFGDVAPMIYFRSEQFSFEDIPGAFDNWATYGKWYYERLMKPRMNLNNDKVLVEVNKIISPDLPKKDIVKHIYEYIQENTRYILVGLDEGGLVPMPSQDVHDLKYGDCKALTFYTQALLNLYDIRSNYVINEANPSNQISFLPEYCDALQGNHIILQVPLEQDTLWMDCTSNDNPFNFLGTFTDDRKVLAVNAKGGTLVNTPKYGIDLYQDIVKADINVAVNGSISVDYNLTNHGLAMTERQFFYRKGDEDQVKELKEDYDHLINLSISNLEIEIDKDNLTSIEKFNLECDQYGEHAGQYYIIPVKFESLSVPNFGKRKTRVHPILFERSFRETKEDTYKMPPGFIPNMTDLDLMYKGEYGMYTRSVEQLSTTKFVVKRVFELNEGEYPASEYLKIKAFFNKIRKAELSKMTIEKKTIRP